jgi:hypothetical protein
MTAEVKPLIISMSGFTLAYAVNMFILMILLDFCFAAEISLYNLSTDHIEYTVSNNVSNCHSSHWLAVTQLFLCCCMCIRRCREAITVLLPSNSCLHAPIFWFQLSCHSILTQLFKFLDIIHCPVLHLKTFWRLDSVFILSWAQSIELVPISILLDFWHLWWYKHPKLWKYLSLLPLIHLILHVIVCGFRTEKVLYLNLEQEAGYPEFIIFFSFSKQVQKWYPQYLFLSISNPAIWL